MTGAERLRFTRIGPEGTREAVERPIALETPVAIEFNGIGYAVLMATPVDLEDLGIGFACAERLIDDAGDVVDMAVHEMEAGTLLRMTLAAGRLPRLTERVRHRVAESGCGMCGIENLEQALRPLPSIAERSRAEDEAIFAALAALRRHQPLNAATGAVHAAACCASDGTIRLVREDVGRHNAFDKLVGAMTRGGLGWDDGFALLSSRCSYELVEKAVLAGCPLLATISAPTTLAISRARSAGLRLRTLARADAMLAC